MSSLYKDKNTWYFSKGSGKSRIKKSLQTSSKKEAKKRQKILDEHYWNAKGIVTVKLSKLIDEYKINGDFIESQAFAYLAIRSYLNKTISYPNTTNVKKSCSGGVLIKNY